jgi:hypothetical protein
MLMAIIVALFMGLTVSAEEIIRDRKILKRESFLNLSWNSYLLSKIGILFLLSAIQTFLFVMIGNLILEVNGMTFSFWLVLFTVSCCANVLGLNISSAFNSAVTVYVMIPLLLIPQMILSGLLFNFDKLNNLISTKGKVPIIADFMASRWAYEAMAVDQFINNDYETAYYEYEKKEANADFKTAFLADELRKKNAFVLEHLKTKNDSIQFISKQNLAIIQSTLKGEKGLEKVDLSKELSWENYSDKVGMGMNLYIDQYQKHYQNEYNENVAIREKKMDFMQKKYNRSIASIKNDHYNESLADLVKNVTTKERMLEYNGQLIQQINPVFQDPKPAHWFDYRTAFFVPTKTFAGMNFTTFTFNLLVIWVMSLAFYFALYFELIKKLIDIFGKVNFPSKK